MITHLKALAKLVVKEVIFLCSFLPIYIINLPVLFNCLKYFTYTYIHCRYHIIRFFEKCLTLIVRAARSIFPPNAEQKIFQAILLEGRDIQTTKTVELSL